MTRVNVGIVGGGLMGREITTALARWSALVDHPVTPKLTAVCDINPDVLAWFDQIESVKTKTTDYRELLGDPDLDVVYVAVRHDLHEPLYCDVIASGKALLAEKPFGIDGAAADRILATMEQHPDVFVRCSSEMPFFPGAQWAVNYINSGALGPIIEASSAFLHSSDLDVTKPINWKRQVQFCGEAGVMNDLGMHAWHVPLRLGWSPQTVQGYLSDIVRMRPGPDGTPVPCETWDNAVTVSWCEAGGSRFPLTVETKRIAPGEKNTWSIEIIGMEGGVRFSTKDPKRVEVFSQIDVPGIGREQSWQQMDVGSQSVWPTVTGGIFETGFSDAILQMWAAFLAEYVGELGERFGCATPAEARETHRIYAGAIASHSTGTAAEL